MGYSLDVPPFCPLTDEDTTKLDTFEDGIIDRLFALGAKRSAEEEVNEPAGGGSKKGRAKKADAAREKSPRSRIKKPEEPFVRGTDKER